MTDLVTGLGFLLALLTAGNSLICEECVTKGTDCKGIPTECPLLTTSCITSLEVTTIGTRIETGFRRACNIYPHVCNEHFVMVGGEQETHIKTDCCTTDGCNTGPREIPEHNTTLNGYQCPVCYALDSYECPSKGYMKCRGDENECVDFAATLRKIDSSTLKFSLKGCITPMGCIIGPLIIPAAKIEEVKRVSCIKAMKPT